MKFELDENQVKKFNDWSSKHEKIYLGAIGGRYEFRFIDTTLGMFVGVYDSVTHEILDLSENENF